MNTLQPSLFDTVQRQRRHYNKVRRKRSERIYAYHQVLQIVKMKMDKQQHFNLSAIQEMCNVGKFPKSLLPNLNGVAVTLDFTDEWYNTIISPYHKKFKRSGNKPEAPVVPETKTSRDTKQLNVIIGELKAELIKINDKISKILELL